MTDARRGLASRLRGKVTIQSATRSPDGKGGQVKSWLNMAVDLPAEVIALRGQEAVAHNLLSSNQLWKVTIRYRGDVTTDHRLLIAGAPMNIRSCADPDGRRCELVMTAESGVKT